MPTNGKAAARINVASDEEDPQLDYIRERIDDELTAGSREELEQRLSSVAGSTGVVDLVCHSTADECHLRLNAWVVDWDNPTVRTYFRTVGKARLRALGVKQLRLIGCRTATTEAAWNTILEIANALGDEIEVFGTKGLVYGRHFDKSGYIGGRLVGSRDRHFRPTSGAEIAGAASGAVPKLRLPAAARVSGIPFDLSRLKPESATSVHAEPPTTWSRVTVPVDWRKRLSELVRPSPAWRLPGLLTSPLKELILPNPSGPSVSKVEVLFRHELVRVYLRDRRHPLVYRVKSPGELASALASS